MHTYILPSIHPFLRSSIDPLIRPSNHSSFHPPFSIFPSAFHPSVTHPPSLRIHTCTCTHIYIHSSMFVSSWVWAKPGTQIPMVHILLGLVVTKLGFISFLLCRYCSRDLGGFGISSMSLFSACPLIRHGLLQQSCSYVSFLCMDLELHHCLPVSPCSEEASSYRRRRWRSSELSYADCCDRRLSIVTYFNAIKRYFMLGSIMLYTLDKLLYTNVLRGHAVPLLSY